MKCTKREHERPNPYGYKHCTLCGQHHTPGATCADLTTQFITPTPRSKHV